MWFRKKRPALTREQSLHSVPVKNQHIEETRTDDGLVLLYLPRRDAWWIRALSRIFFIPKGRRIALDELGSTVWGMFDGETDVGGLIKRFAEKYRLSKREAELSVVAYLRMLARKGLIGIAVLDAPRRPAKQARK